MLKSPFATFVVALRLFCAASALTFDLDDIVLLEEEVTAIVDAYAGYLGLASPSSSASYLELDSSQVINGIAYVSGGGHIAPVRIHKYSVETSLDNSTWIPQANGTFVSDHSTKYVGFPNVKARFVRLTGLTQTGTQFPWNTASSFSALVAPTSTVGGQWSPMIAFPLVPAAAFIRPDGKIVTFSSYRTNEFNNYPDLVATATNNTYTATYDPYTGAITELDIINTSHDMFCPGLSFTFDGKAVVTGGDSSKRTSIYDPTTSNWTVGAEMGIGRGYQSSATTSNGGIFTIGGSWSGGEGGKNGEIYDPSTNVWTNLTGCPVEPILTQDAQGIYRADSHAWLFGWTDGWVFQAGPSSAMNWYSTNGTGSQVAAGLRNDAPDSMNGNPVLYDAVAGKIFCAGGSPSYQNSNATSLAYHITIGAPPSAPNVTTLTSMNYKRAFANSVILPNGKIFVTGGQTYAVPFTDTDAVMNPELWDPETQEFSILPAHTVPRNYHSIALLMQDGRVFTGGAGLCGSCAENHEDAQIYSPAYLFTSNGTLATRPLITSVSASTIAVGSTLTVSTDTPITAFSLIRFGSATHTVNTDQRRIALTPGTTNGTTYKLDVPSDPGVALPGYWMLFALDSKGVPSISTTIVVTL